MRESHIMTAIDYAYKAALQSYSVQDHYLEAQVYAQLGYLFFRVKEPDIDVCEGVVYTKKVEQYEKAQEFYDKLNEKISEIRENEQNGPLALDDEAWL